MGNKTVKFNEFKQTADAGRTSVHNRRDTNLEVRKEVRTGTSNAQTSVKRSLDVRKEVRTGTSNAQTSVKRSLGATDDKGATGTELSVESWSVPNFDMFMRKKANETDPLQSVFDKVKLERNMDIDRASDLYTTSREKYLIKLIREGHMIPTNIVSHVLDRFCGTTAHMINDNYGCCCGYILTKEDFMQHDFAQCNWFHRLNADLLCYGGNLFYLVDILSNPFGTWNPKSMIEDGQNVQKVYEMILQRWPNYQLYDADVSKYISVSERYLINIINAGHDIPSGIIAHVVDGCDVKAHIIDENYGCCYGFILTTSEFLSHDSAKKKNKPGQLEIGRIYGRDGKPVRNPEAENFEHCEAKHDLNEKLKCWFGVLFYELVSCQTPCKTLRSQRQLEAKLLVPKQQGVKEVYRRIKFKRLNDLNRKEQYTWYDNMHAWEKYLVTLIRSGHDISIELISHVIDGCHIKAHMLDDNFGCCYGFILTKHEFMMHFFDECHLDHEINNELRCDSGWVYHVEAPRDCPFYDDKHLGSAPRRLQKVKGTVPQDDAPNPRPPPPPAPPPPDHLDH